MKNVVCSWACGLGAVLVCISLLNGCGDDSTDGGGGATLVPGTPLTPGATPPGVPPGVTPPATPGAAPAGVGTPAEGTAGSGDTPATPGTPPATPPGTPPVASSGNVWSQMGYDEKNWYFNPNETTLTTANASSLVQKWSFTVAGFPPGTPVVAEGKVFVMATGGTYAIDLASGTEVWSSTAIKGTASVAYEPGFIYVHDEGSNLYKLSTADGTPAWGPVKADAQPDCDGTSSPILGGGKVIVGHSCGIRELGMGAGINGARGGVEAHNTADGSKAWTYWTAGDSETGAMVWSSVGIDVEANTVYAATGNNYTAQGPNSDAIHAIDLGTGAGKWKTQVNNNDVWSFGINIGGPDTDFGANPIITPGAIAAGEKGSGFWALNPDTGAILWSREGLSTARDQAHGGFLMNGAYDGATFYGLVNDTSNKSTKLYAMNGGAMGSDVFPPKMFAGKYAWGAPSIANGVLVAPVDDTLYILDAANGNELKMFNTGGTIAAGAAAIVDGNVIVQSGLSYPLDASAKTNNQVICYGLP